MTAFMVGFTGNVRLNVELRRTREDTHVARPVALLPIADPEAVLRKARLHMDATRSSALFAQRLVLVEGVTDAAVLRQFARAWAGADPDKTAFDPKHHHYDADSREDAPRWFVVDVKLVRKFGRIITLD